MCLRVGVQDHDGDQEEAGEGGDSFDLWRLAGHCLKRDKKVGYFFVFVFFCFIGQSLSRLVESIEDGGHVLKRKWRRFKKQISDYSFQTEKAIHQTK